MDVWAKFYQNMCSGLRDVKNGFKEAAWLVLIVNIGHSDLIWTNWKKSPKDSPNQMWMISVQCFYERFFKELAKNAQINR